MFVVTKARMRYRDGRGSTEETARAAADELMIAVNGRRFLVTYEEEAHSLRIEGTDGQYVHVPISWGVAVGRTSA